jgi:rhodanese-related sulfurtransferase
VDRTISPQALNEKLMHGDDIVLIDVRRKEDYDKDPGMIPGAEWRDPTHVEDWADRLTADKDIIIYCVRGGSVSNSIVDALLGKNLKAQFIEGGIEAWRNTGM